MPCLEYTDSGLKEKYNEFVLFLGLGFRILIYVDTLQKLKSLSDFKYCPCICILLFNYLCLLFNTQSLKTSNYFIYNMHIGLGCQLYQLIGKVFIFECFIYTYIHIIIK